MTDEHGPAYVPERWWLIMNRSVFGGLGASAVVVLVLSDGDVWLHGGVAAIAVLSLVIVLRTRRVGIQCTTDTLIVRGAVWSRRIPRAAIVDIDTEPHDSFVLWKGTRLWRFTPLTMMWGGSSGWIPRASRRERVRFLARLARWAESGRD